jgi:hypothetical protein
VLAKSARKKQGVPMMLAEFTINLHYFGFHIKDIRINQIVFFNDCKFLCVGSGGGQITIATQDYYCYKFQMRHGIFNPILHGKRLFQ